MTCSVGNSISLPAPLHFRYEQEEASFIYESGSFEINLATYSGRGSYVLLKVISCNIIVEIIGIHVMDYHRICKFMEFL